MDLYKLKRIKIFMEEETSGMNFDEIIQRLRRSYSPSEIKLAFRCLGYKESDFRKPA